MAQDTTILDKIKGLLALAGSENVHEAELALKAAKRLMLKHSVSEQDIAEHADEFKVTNIHLDNDCISNISYKLGVGREYVLSYHSSIASYCGCFMVIHNNGVMHEFWGTRMQLDVFQFLTESLINQGTVLRAAALKQHGRGAYWGFWQGYFEGLYHRLAPMREEGEQGLVLYGQARQAAVDLYGDMKPHHQTLAAGNEAGRAAAMKASVGAGLNGKGQGLLS